MCLATTYVCGENVERKFLSSLISMPMVAASPKLETMNSALIVSPGAASILDELAVTSTEVEAGTMAGSCSLQNELPARVGKRIHALVLGIHLRLLFRLPFTIKNSLFMLRSF